MGGKERKHSNSDDDTLFRREFADAQPLSVRGRHVARSKPAPRASSRRKDEEAALSESRADDMRQSESDFTDELSFQRGSVSRKVMRELRRGRYAIQQELDLHGLTRAEAKTELQDFIYECADRGFRCVRVVHGKGLGSGPKGPVLRAAVNRWLRRWDNVLAFCPARTQDGGTGAVYVLLRR